MAATTPSSPSLSRTVTRSSSTLSTTSQHAGLKTAAEGDPTNLIKAEQGAQQKEGNEGSEKAMASGVWVWMKRVCQFLIDQWFLLGIGVFIGLAAAFPNVARNNGVLEAQWSIKILAVAIIFFISGLTLPLRNLYIGAGNWRLHLVCNVTSFLIFPTVVYAIIKSVQAADPEYKRFNRWVLVGMQVMGTLPTTVSSNVVMTGQAGGDQAATTIEVMLGNLVGTFLTPALLQLFLNGNLSFGRPQAAGGGGTGQLYKNILAQLGYSVFIPLFVGEVIQYFFPRQTKWTREKFRLGKVGSFCLLLVIWSTFSGAFHTGAFTTITGEAVALIVGTNVFLYLFFTFFLFAVCRLIPVPAYHLSPAPRRKLISDGVGPLVPPEQTIACMFTAAAKGAALGAPIFSVLYAGLAETDSEAEGIASLPFVLYQGSQVVMGQATVAILKRWNEREKRRTAEKAGVEGGGKAGV